MLESLLPGVRDLSLQPVDRLGLQNDLFSLVPRSRHAHAHLLSAHNLKQSDPSLRRSQRFIFGFPLILSCILQACG